MWVLSEEDFKKLLDEAKRLRANAGNLLVKEEMYYIAEGIMMVLHKLDNKEIQGDS